MSAATPARLGRASATIRHRTAALLLLALAALALAPPAGAAPTLTTLVTFTAATDGAGPAAGLIFDAAGNLYGTTSGGTGNSGTVFKLAAGTHALTTLAKFAGFNGAGPQSGLIFDAAGNLYGTTTYRGGATNYGTVFKVAAGTNAITTLVTFNGTGNGANPYAGLIADAAGNLYGTTYVGGANEDGTLFKVAAGTNALTTLVTFGGTNGAQPYGGLISDAAGNLYGTTNIPGSVFKLDPSTNAFTTRAKFDYYNGIQPFAGLTADAAGNLYGTTVGGGPGGGGTVFKVTADTNAITTLASFSGAANGMSSYAGVILDAAGNLYGTTYFGGASNLGTVFKVSADTNTLTTLVTFTGAANGAHSTAGLVADADGNLYGTTYAGGASDKGTVFMLSGTGFVTPEPGALGLAAVAAVTFLARRRRNA